DATTIVPPLVFGGTIWPATAAPSSPWLDSSGLTVGVKFRADVAGTITGLRFYKGAGNNGSHTGLLYTAAGTLLAQAAFTGEPASGWQQVSLSPAVAIAANTTYVVAYFTTSGFAYSAGYFAGGNFDNA